MVRLRRNFFEIKVYLYCFSIRICQHPVEYLHTHTGVLSFMIHTRKCNALFFAGEVWNPHDGAPAADFFGNEGLSLLFFL